MPRTSALCFALLLLSGCGRSAGAPSGNSGSGSTSGHWAEPRSTFTLPVPEPGAGKPALYHPELTSEFATVDWSTVDRLYIPAGAYRSIYEALSENQEKEPAANPDLWRALPPPADDVRLSPDSPHPGLGIRWPPPG